MTTTKTATVRTAAAKSTSATPKGKTVTTSKTAPAQAKPLSSVVSEKVALRASTLKSKAPTDLHIDMAAWMTELTGVTITPKQAQIVANLRMDYQASASNQARDAYKGLEAEEKQARSVHMTQANLDAKAAIKARKDAEAKAEEEAAKAAAAAVRKGNRKPRKTAAQIKAEKAVVEAKAVEAAAVQAEVTEAAAQA